MTPGRGDQPPRGRQAGAAKRSGVAGPRPHGPGPPLARTGAPSRVPETSSAALAQATTVEGLEEALWKAAQARAKVLDTFGTDEIIEIVAAAAEVWRRPHYRPRTDTLDILSRELGMARPMLEIGLDATFSTLAADSLTRLVDIEAQDRRALDGPVRRPDGSLRRLTGPQMVFHSLAGNVPGLAIPHLAASLLARSICVLRDSSRQPVLHDAFVQTLAGYSAELAAMIVTAAWPPGDAAMESFIFEQASRVEISGEDRTIRAIAARHPTREVVARGERLSLGLVPRESDTDRWTRPFVEDMVMYDGLGCLTPHVILVEGPLARARRMAKGLAPWLERRERLWPRQPRSLESEHRRRAFIGSAEVSVACNPERMLLRGRKDAWLVHLNPAAPMAPGPGLRCITVVPVDGRRETEAALREAEAPLAAVGLSLEPSSPGYGPIVNMLRRRGATLVCLPGDMQSPPLAWQQDGRKRLGDLLEWRREDEL